MLVPKIQRVSFPPLAMVEVGDAKGRRGFGEGGEQEGLEEQPLFVQKGREQERNPGITEGLGMGGTLKVIQFQLGSFPEPKGGS